MAFCPFSENRRIDCEKSIRRLVFIGERDFTAFSANRRVAEQNSVRKVWKVKLTEKNELIEFVVEGKAFYKMVRSMVGALLDVGSEKWNQAKSNKFSRVVSGRNSRQCPAKGLSLEKVFYRKPRVV